MEKKINLVVTTVLFTICAAIMASNGANYTFLDWMLIFLLVELAGNLLSRLILHFINKKK